MYLAFCCALYCFTVLQWAQSQILLENRLEILKDSSQIRILEMIIGGIKSLKHTARFLERFLKFLYPIKEETVLNLYFL